GIVLAFIFEYMDPTFKSSQDIESELNLRFLGSIPRRNMIERSLISDPQKKSNYAKHYQSLFDQLYFSIKDRKIKTIMFTAATSEEETSTVMTNLGFFMSQKGDLRVLLVDANFRNPSLHKLLKVENSMGFADVLEKRVPLREITKEIHDNLHAVPAGKNELNPLMLLDPAKIKEALQDIQGKYDIILIDCPNLKSYKDPVVLSLSADTTIVVVNENQTRRKVLKMGLKSLQERNVNILGSVLNNKTFPIPRFVYERV
ncbi:MAG: AAA family ATPase, partial [Candidatus Omnitrophica bacterium]|nr:AAA family ATPase [Candidatus Omnitrophota bacterium]